MGDNASTGRNSPPRLAEGDAVTTPGLIIVDAANVVGSRPDGWWRDRAAATARLRDRLAVLAAEGLSHAGPSWAHAPPLDVVLVAEGRARGLDSTDSVQMLDAPGSGDDAVVRLVTEQAPRRPCLVVTSDRQLQRRVDDAGGHILGASALR